MSASYSRRQTCRLCGGSAHDVVLKLTPTPPADAYVPLERRDEVQETYPLDLFLCRDCHHVQLLGVVRPETIYCDYLYETTSSLGLVEHFQRYAEEVCTRLAPAPGSLVIDIGSNDGTLLKGFRARGMRVLGIDPAREIARQATAAGIETLPVFFSAELARTIRAQRGPAAIVTANNLFANVDDLSEMTMGIRELLAPEGVFVFESYYLADVLQNMVFDFIYHEHLSSFSVRPLAAFFRRYDLELIDAQRVPTKGGSLRYTVQRSGGARSVSPSVAALTELERQRGLDRVETYRTFAQSLEAVKGQLLSLLRELKAQGKRIGGFGASATTTTLLYHFELREFLDFLVDDNPQRHHLFSPGYHIPVLPPAALYERKPEAVLILAWRYAKPIMERHHAYRRQGGGFIVPLPVVQVIRGGETSPRELELHRS
jgi:SAM-dependent methyltransferase